MPVETVITGSRVPVKVWTDQIEDQARKQLQNTAALPFVFHHIAAMPDVHLGIGATVGSVVANDSGTRPRWKPCCAENRREFLTWDQRFDVSFWS